MRWIGVAKACRKRGLMCVLVALDVKNAFNTLSWRIILEAIRERQLLGQLQSLLSDYLSERKIVTYCCDGTLKRNVYVGVPQGSILQLLLWNLVYGGLLRVSGSVKDVDAVAFADDLGLVITMRKSQNIGDRVREAMKLVKDWCKDAGLYLAQEKTEVILFTG
jgi:hypothetical protein